MSSVPVSMVRGGVIAATIRSGFIRGKWNRFRVRLENGPHSGARPGALMDHTFFALVAWPVVDGLRFHTTRERKPQLAQATVDSRSRHSDSPTLLSFYCRCSHSRIVELICSNQSEMTRDDSS